MVEKIETDVDKLLLVLPVKKNVPISSILEKYICFAKIELLFYFETKSSLFSSVFMFSTISQILKRKFYLLIS